MAENSLNITSTTELNTKNYAVSGQSLDYAEGDEVIVTFPNALKYRGYYKKYGQLKAAINTLCLYVTGKGFTCNTRDKVLLDHIQGNGVDSEHKIFWNMLVTAFIHGDAFAEIIRSEKGTLLNLKPISPERMRIIYGKNGMIKRYEEVTNESTFTKYKTEEIFHISNDRIEDEQKGTSVVDSCMWVIDALEEARRDYRVVLHRNVVPLRIIEVDTEDTAKRDRLKAQYKTAIENGEVLIVPKGAVQVTTDKITIQDPIAWIQSLENYFYLAVGIPRVIASPDGLSEGSSKVGYLLFEPIYTWRQLLLEEDIRTQLGIEVVFNRPPSLMDNVQGNEAKNTSQTSFQPKDASVGMGRE